MINWSSNFKIGFLGAGQLARMSALEAAKYGIQTLSFSDRKEQEPLEQYCTSHFKGDFSNIDDLVEFAKQCDVITLENEFIDSSLLKQMVEKSGTPLYPSPQTFEAIENKWIEKESYAKAGIPVCPYQLIQDPTTDFNTFGEKHGWPYLLKSAKGGYDGYGNATVNNEKEAFAAFDKLGGSKGRDILAEAFVPFRMELAVTVARNETGIEVYPCVQSIQENHICTKVLCPAPVSAKIQQKTQELAEKAMIAIDARGVFSFEFFLTKEGDILLNESAPRPHNSAHYTIEACETSQFENHIRAVLNLPLGSSKLRKPAAVMINLLGTQNGEAMVKNAISAVQEPDGHLHIYGKLSSKIGRKMGHYTLLGDELDSTFQKALLLTKAIEI
jgi:5-(carboxyamino)imidazole ribonucleotide synthase